ncbi:hypothetical protein VNO78_00881 [Psophocarpus tetragonolobus]|uniref:Uncharacterized protein n=1 Tax=Psophocarpus tetragonolobus TaxID=3891 RepID=A0AAN9XV94_PSOTE
MKQVWKVKQVQEKNGMDVEEWTKFSFLVENDSLEVLAGCYIAHVKSSNIIFSIKQRLSQERVNSLSIIPMGRDMMLLKLIPGEDLAELVKDVEGVQINDVSFEVRVEEEIFTPMSGFVSDYQNHLKEGVVPDSSNDGSKWWSERGSSDCQSFLFNG